MPSSNRGPIALFDSGEGGLSVLQRLVDRFPQTQFWYAADSGHFPYGEKSLEDVRTWFLAFAHFFVRHGARAIIIACNTATAAALAEAQSLFPIPIIGVVQAAVVRAAKTSLNRRIGVLSTEATYRSDLYPRALKAIDPTIQVTSQPCPILVSMAENGQIDGRDVEVEVRECIAPVLSAHVDTIILGCTHFPHMREVFDRVVENRVKIVDPALEIANYLPDSLHLMESPGPTPPVSAWTTGDPAQFADITAKLCPHLSMVTRPLYWNRGQLVD